MLDFTHLPKSGWNDFRCYYAAQSVGTVIDSWQTWSKPRGASWLYGLVVSAGGGGASPGIGALGGGGGGGCGRAGTFLVPAMLIPDTLYIRVGVGGAGGLGSTTSTGNNGTTGDTTYIVTTPAINPSTGFEGLLLNAPGAGGGQTTATTTGGAAGASATAMVFSNQFAFAFGTSTVGSVAGAGGNNGAIGVTNTWGIGGNAALCGGAGGGGGNSNHIGGAIGVTGGAGIAPFPSSGTAAAGTRGADGYGYNHNFSQLGPRGLYCFAFTGGSGGGSTSGATGGSGGHGAYGCGGGGGGGAATTTGAGGNGGDGLVILMAW